MIQWRWLYLVIYSLFFALSPADITAQQVEEGQEVYLTFRHEGVVNQYITAWYQSDGTFLLPHTELFQALEIRAETDLTTNSVSGRFPERGLYRINYRDGTATLGDHEVEFNADQFRISEMDYFIHPDILFELFGLDFTINFNQLSLRLEAQQTMPVVARAEREQRRARAQRTEINPIQEFYPLEYDRERHLLQGGFLDYNLTANLTNDTNSYLFQSGFGGEILGGDLQGTVFGSWSNRSQALRSNGLRWRYGIRNRSWITRVSIGQTTSRGILPVAYSGVQISNDPLEPRQFFDNFQLQGRTDPESEVELYRNNSLIDYQQADDLGQYRFDFPLTYGTSRYNVRIYTPDGEFSEDRSRIQVPYTFTPPGEVNYTVNAGRLDNPLPGTVDRSLITRARVSTGLANWLTASGGAEYFSSYHQTLPTFTTALNARVLRHYLVSAEVADGILYRTSANVIYPSGVNLGASYDHYLQEGGIYNRAGNQSAIQGNLFVPIQMGGLPLFFRTAFTQEVRSISTQTRYSVDLSSRIGRTNFRFSFRDAQSGRLNWITTPGARLSSSVTYTFPRSRTTARPLQGLYFRGQLSFLPHQSQIYDAEVQVSRRILGNGRVQLAGGRNVLGDYNFFRFNLSFDFNRIRTNTSARNSRSNYSLSQGIRGSIGVDPVNQNVQLNSRQQVGSAALAVRLFIDKNNSGTYDRDDELLPNNAIRIERAGGAIFYKDGISYLTLLQPYRQYNLSVNKSAFHNPLLVPVSEQFSIITDPNQFKIIDIPLYTSGVIEGKVHRMVDQTRLPLSGARLFLTNTDVDSDFSDFEQELRTFSDGSFYSYEIPPGDYKIQIDPRQLELLNMNSEPVEFTIEPLAEGDYLGNLELILTPVEEPTVPEITREDERNINWLEGYPDWIRVGEWTSSQCRFPLQVGSFSTARRAANAATEAEETTGLEMDVYYNAISGIYAVRSTERFEFSKAVQLAEVHINQLPANDLSVIGQCEYTQGNLRPVPFAIILQLGAFYSRENAKQLVQLMNNRYNLNPQILQEESDDLYRVQIGPLKATEGFSMANRIMAEESVQNLYIIQTAESSSTGLRFEYSLQAGRYEQIDEALSCADILIHDMNEPSYILIDDLDNYHLILERRFTNWRELLNARDNLKCNGNLYRPVIHLKETPVHP